MTRSIRRSYLNIWLSVLALAALSSLAFPARAQVPLSAYMDKNGFIDV
jgi:hypothetical protein